MSDSILTSVKKGVGGITESDTSFDDDIIMHTNSTLSKLTQLGVGPKQGFRIRDKSSTWEDFIGDDPRLDMVRSFVVLSVRMMFDPPSSGTAAKAFEQQIAEYEWRLNAQVETPGDETDDQNNDVPDSEN